MIAKDFKGYNEGKDVSTIPHVNLVYPSKNVLVLGGKIYTRDGIENDGVAASGSLGVHSEFVWKDALGGERPIRIFGQTVQVKYNDVWRTIYTALDSDVIRCFFATFVDINTTTDIVKKRLVISDGSPHLYVWNGAIGDVESATSNSVVLPTADGTCLQQGFDAGNVTAQTLLHFIGTAATANSEESQNNDPTAQTLSISGTFDTTPVADDVIIAKPVKFSNVIASTFDIDVVVNYKNHIIICSYDSPSMYFSHIETYSLATGFNFTQPEPVDRTALTAILLRIDGKFTAAVVRKNVLWVSDADGWYKVTKSAGVNAYSLWVDVEKVETGDRKGALPMAVAKYKDDAIYVAQDKTIQRVTSNEVLGVDEIRTISDDIEGLLERIDMTNIRLYYLERAIYLVSVVDGILIILDMIEGYFQPPQYLPISCISVIDGVKYGHHSATAETFELFTGRSDLTTPIEAKIAFGLYHGEHDLRYKRHGIFGLIGRLNEATIVDVKQNFEEEGAKTETEFEIDGGTIKTYAVNDDVSFGTHPYGSRSLGGADMKAEELNKFFVFSRFKPVSWFEFQPQFTISGDQNEFQLLAWWIDDEPSDRKIGDDLFISK